MKPRISNHMRSQLRAQTLVQTRLQAVPSPGRTLAQEASQGFVPEQSSVRSAARARTTASLSLPARMQAGFTELVRLWQWLLNKRQMQVRSKRLRVVETASLGEKRFVAVLRVDGAQFLIGGGSDNVALLASLEGACSENRFAQVLQQTTQDGSVAP